MLEVSNFDSRVCFNGRELTRRVYAVIRYTKHLILVLLCSIELETTVRSDVIDS